MWNGHVKRHWNGTECQKITDFKKLNSQIIDFGVTFTSNVCLRLDLCFQQIAENGAYRSERRCTGPQESIRILEDTWYPGFTVAALLPYVYFVSLVSFVSFALPVLFVLPSGVIKHGWKILYQWRFLDRKITDFYGPWLPAPHVWWNRMITGTPMTWLRRPPSSWPEAICIASICRCCCRFWMLITYIYIYIYVYIYMYIYIYGAKLNDGRVPTHLQ